MKTVFDANWSDLVWEFMRMAKQTKLPSNKLTELYGSLVVEEFNEWNSATTDEATLDACVDLIWVILGYAVSRGFDIEGAFREVARANFSKVSTQVNKERNGKVRKPKGWKPPDLSRFLPVKYA